MKGMGKIKQTESPMQSETKTEQTVDSDQPEAAIPNEQVNVPDNTVREEAPSNKRKILKRIGTYVLQKPAGTGTLLLGIAAIITVFFTFIVPLIIPVKDTSKSVQTEKSAKSLETEELIQKKIEDSKADIISRAILDDYKLQLDEKIEKAIEKCHSLANMLEEIDNNLAAGAWFSTGYLRVQLGEHEKAISDFSKALDLKPDYVEAYYNLGTAKLKIGKFKEAIDDFDKVLELDADYPQAYYSRGFANLSLRKYEDASADFRKALDLKPDYVEAKRGLKEVKSYLESIKPINPNTANAEAYYSRGAARFSIGEYQDASR